MRLLKVVCVIGLVSLSPARLEVALASVHPVSFDFRQTKVGDEVEVVVNIQNTSPFTLSLAGGGTGVAEFGGGTSCGGGIAAGATCQIFYRFMARVKSGQASRTSTGAGSS